jgi:hypothetical protein
MKYIIIITILLSNFLFAQVNNSTKSLSDVENNSSLADTSNIVLADSLNHKTLVDTLAPLYQKALGENSFFIPRNQIDLLNYRYGGDLLQPFDFYFTRDQGFVGQPNEISIYGTGFNGISYLQDGILINNRFTNSLDLNLVQTENIDSIEIVPLARGFLFGPYNNNVTVNFITRDFLSRPPYSRIKYYQGPNGEAFFDVLFNSWMYKRFNASFDISNRKTDSSYSNTHFSLWQTRFKFKYLLSNKINILGDYSYITSQTGLNGGVDISKVDTLTTDINSLLYDQQLAPVIYSDRYEQTRQQNISLKFLGKFTENSSTNLALYYRSYFDAITGTVDSAYFANTDRNKIYGASLNQAFTLSSINLSLIGNYEKYDLNYDALYQALHPEVNYNSSVYSLSAIVTFETENKMFVPSIFYKTSHNSYFKYNPNTSGYGIDMKANFSENFSFYAGFSFDNIQDNTVTKNFEVSGEFNNDFISGGLRYFSRKDYYTNNLPIPYPSGFHTAITSLLPTSLENMNGFGGHLNLEFWKIILENTAAYYFASANSDTVLSSVPKYTYKGGIFYKGLLFNGNLDLKTGIVFYYNDERRPSVNNSFVNLVGANRRVDLTVAGVIQKAATIYLTWENLLNTKYFIVPYYPMPARNLRFGIAWELFN